MEKLGRAAVFCGPSRLLLAAAVALLALRATPGAGQCTLASAPVKFEPNPPGAPRPWSMSSGYSTAFAFYRNAAGAPRLMAYEAFGYSVLDLSNPASPFALKYDDLRMVPVSPTTNPIIAHGDGQSYIASMGVSADGQRVAFSVNGPADPPWHTLAGRSDGGEGFGVWGDFAPNRASGSVIQKSGSRYIAYTIHASSSGTAADVTTLPTANAAFQPLNLASETTTFAPGQSLMLAGNYLVYMADSGVQVIDASNPGPSGSITSAFKKVVIAGVPGDPYGRIPANFTAAVDPANPAKLWVLVELGSWASASENSPSYGLVSITRNGNGSLAAPVSAGPLFRVPSAAGELWGRSGNSATLVASNGNLFVLMWATRILPSQRFILYSTTANGWTTPMATPVAAAGFTGLAASSATAFAGSGNAVYVYLPTGPAAFVILLACQPVNVPVFSSLLVTNASAGGAAVSDGETVFASEQLTIAPTVIPAPAYTPLSSWRFDFDFHAGNASEDAGALPRIRNPDNAVFGSPAAPPAQATLVGPCDPEQATGGDPNGGAGCWASVRTNTGIYGGPDWTGTEAPGAVKAQKLALEATNAYGSANTAVFTVNWQLPAARLASTQVLSGAPLVSASDGHPTATGFKWYFGATPNGLTRAGCNTASCVPTLDTRGTYSYWLTATYANGYQTPDYAGSAAMGTYTVTDFAPSFTVNGSAAGPVTAVIGVPIAVTNGSQRGAGITGTYQYSLCLIPCADAWIAWNMADPANGSGTPPSSATIPTPADPGAYALKIRIAYTGGTATWPDPAGSGSLTVNAVVPIPKIRIWVNGANPCPPGSLCVENAVTAHLGDALVAHALVNGADDPNDGTDHWDFSNAPGTSTANPQFVTGNPVSLTYTGAGVFGITLTRNGVAYPFPNAAVITAPLVSAATASPSSTVQSGQTVTFSCSATGGTPPYGYTWSGTFGTISTQQSFSITPTNGGSSKVTQQLTCGVTDAGGATSSSVVTLTVMPKLVVGATGSPSPTPQYSSISFSCSASGGSGTYPSYAWAFGDGQAGSGPWTSHAYQTPGTFQAVCTVTDSASNVANAAAGVTVTPLPLAAAATVTPGAVLAGTAAQFSCSASGGVGPYAYAWSFSDGQTAPGQNVAHVFAHAGAQSGTCALTDSSQATAGSTAGLTVTAPPSSLYTLTPCRLLDTRVTGPALQPAGPADRRFVLAGSCGVVAGAVAVSANVTVTNVTAGGVLSIYPGDGAPAGTNTVAFSPGKTRANNAMITLSSDGSGAIKVQNTSPGTLDLIIDVNGYFR